MLIGFNVLFNWPKVPTTSRTSWSRISCIPAEVVTIQACMRKSAEYKKPHHPCQAYSHPSAPQENLHELLSANHPLHGTILAESPAAQLLPKTHGGTPTFAPAKTSTKTTSLPGPIVHSHTRISSGTFKRSCSKLASALSQRDAPAGSLKRSGSSSSSGGSTPLAAAAARWTRSLGPCRCGVAISTSAQPRKGTHYCYSGLTNWG